MRRALLVSPLRVAVAHRASSVSPRPSADALGVGQPGESLEALLLAARAALPLRMGEEASGEAEVAGGADASGREQPQRHPRRQAVLRVHEPGQVDVSRGLENRCQRMESGKVCRFRHLVPLHPDAIADRFKSGLLSEEEIRKYQLRPCEPFETNPFAPADAKICFDFLNHHVCSRNQDMKICRFRHLLPEHPDAIRDRARSM